MTDETRICPFCGEEIKFVAIKCKHCGTMLSGSEPGADASDGWRGQGGPLQMGTTIREYRIEKILGQGGMGEVYKAVHVQTEQLVAMKVIAPELMREDSIRNRFLEEARVMADLNHPNVVLLLNFFEEGGRLFLIMDFVDGRDLEGVLNERVLSGAEAVDIASRILAGLSYGHTRPKPVIHRDIKPANILLGDDGRVVITDFGIAKATQTTTATQSSMMAGTLDYMSVERFRGESPLHSDVYAVGLVGWELLAGRKACPAGDIPAKIGWHHSRGAPDVRSERPETPSWLAELLLALAAKDAKRRPLDASKALDLMTKLRGSSMPSSVEPSTVDLAPETWQAPEVSPLAAPTALEPVAPQPAPVAPPGPVLPSPEPVDPAKSVRPSAQRKARRAGPRPASSPIKKSGRRFPWATLLALLVAFAVGGFILHRIMQGH